MAVVSFVAAVFGPAMACFGYAVGHIGLSGSFPDLRAVGFLPFAVFGSRLLPAAPALLLAQAKNLIQAEDGRQVIGHPEVITRNDRSGGAPGL